MLVLKLEKICQLLKNLKRKIRLVKVATYLTILRQWREIEQYLANNINKELARIKLHSIEYLLTEVGFGNKSISIIVAQNLLGNISINKVITDDNDNHSKLPIKMTEKGINQGRAGFHFVRFLVKK